MGTPPGPAWASREYPPESVHLALSPWRISEQDLQGLEEAYMHAKQALVAEVMLVDPLVIHADALLEEVDIVFRGTYSKGIPVVDSDGALVGVISDADLAAYRFAHSQPPDEMVQNEATNDARRGHRSSR